MSAVDRELTIRIAQLDPDEKRRVLEYVRTLGPSRPLGTPGSALRPLFGSMSKEDVAEMRQAIEEGCERIDPDGW
jgi:hypothetical protein